MRKVTISDLVNYLQQFPSSATVVWEEDDPSLDPNDYFISLSVALEQLTEDHNDDETPN